MNRGTRAFSLMGVLGMTMVLSVLALGLVRLSVGHLWLTSRANSSLACSSLANSAAAAAVAKVQGNREYGPADPPLVVTSDLGRAVVHFSPERTREDGLPYSTNNLDGTTPVEGYGGRQVAPGTARIIATSHAGSSRRTVDAVLRLPPFPWAILTGGKLSTAERVLIGTLPEGAWPPPPDADLLPADVLANATDARSVVLDGECTITGDVESPGGIVTSGRDVVVKGEIRPGSEPVEVPQLRASQYDPAQRGIDFDRLAATDVTSILPLQGAVRSEGDVEVAGLQLSGAQLFVDGDLKVSGSIEGSGVVICTGDVDISSISLQGATELAVLADGRIDLQGAGRTGSTVRGTFYAGDSLSAKNLTVVGTVVAGNASGDVKFENARMIAEPPDPIVTNTATTIYVGRHYPPPAGQTGRGNAVLAVFADERPSYQYGFSIQLGPPGPNGGYPRSMTIGTGWYALSSQSFYLRSPRDLDRVDDWLSQFTQDGMLDVNPVNLPRVPRGLTRNIFSTAVSGANMETIQDRSIVNLAGDLSRFLPFEDQIRVISWHES